MKSLYPASPPFSHWNGRKDYRDAPCFRRAGYNRIAAREYARDAPSVLPYEVNLMPSGIDLLPAVIPGVRPQARPEASPDLAPESGPPGLDKPFIVIVYNDDYHTFEQVEIQLQKATACTLEKAEAFAMEIHTQGRSVVFAGQAEECERVACVLREIKLQVETDKA